ncbi:DUF3114 domain-containing protein [Furfurilactobacillus sp. WILCCON 0119]
MVQHKTLVSLIQPPTSLSGDAMPQYVNGTFDLLTQLADHQRWDEAALTALAKRIATTVNDANVVTGFSDWQASSRTAGGVLFKTLFTASTLPARDKLNRLFTGLGAHLSTTTGDLISDNPFADDLAPNDPFWHALAQTVRAAYPSGLAQDDANVRMTHQLRYVIDNHNVAFIRQHFGKDETTDLGALMAFDRDARRHGQAATTASSSRLHNKQPETLVRGVLPALPMANFKRVINFHSEFIITTIPVPTFLTVPLATIANVNDVPAYVRALPLAERNALVNGASFNYADSNDHGEPNSVHDLFDLQYGDNDPMVRRLAFKPYVSPKVEPRAITMLQQQYEAGLEQ